MNLKVGDKVIVIAGSNKGREGTIKKVLKQEILSQYQMIAKNFQ